MKSAGWGFLALALLASGCAAPGEQQGAGDDRLECELDGHIYFISHPWACLREGGRVVEVPASADSRETVAVKVGWQGREEIKAGRLRYDSSRRRGSLRLELPAAGDVCEGDFLLTTPTDGDWTATCDSGQQIEARLFLNQAGVTISAHGKDGEGRSFGFYPKPGEG